MADSQDIPGFSGAVSEDQAVSSQEAVHPKRKRKGALVAGAVALVIVMAIIAVGVLVGGSALIAPYASSGSIGSFGKSSYELLFECGPVLVQDQDGLWGYVDESGNYVIEPTYEYAYSFAVSGNGLAPACNQEGKWGYIDETGQTVVDFRYSKAYCFSDGLALVQDDNGFGFIDKDGNEAIPCQYADAKSFSNGLAGVQVSSSKKLWGYIDKSGTIVIEPKYYDCLNFTEEGVTFVCAMKSTGTDTYMSLIDEHGEMVGSNRVYILPTMGSTTGLRGGYANWSDEGLYPVKTAGSTANEYAYLDTKGNLAITSPSPYKFSQIGSFVNGYARFKDAGSGLWGFIDSSGKVVYEPMFTDILRFNGDRAIVATGEPNTGLEGFGEDGDYLIVKMDGSTVLDIGALGAYDIFASLSDQMFVAFMPLAYSTSSSLVENEDFHWTCIDISGELVYELEKGITPEGSYSSDLSYVKAQQSDGTSFLHGVLGKNGEWLIQPIFKSIMLVQSSSS